MQSIINPWIFYWIEVLERLDVIISLTASLMAIALIMTTVTMIVENKLETLKKVVKILTTIVIVSTTVAIAIPSKETIYTMIVIDNITTDNINMAKESVKDTVDYIVEKIKEITEEKS